MNEIHTVLQVPEESDGGRADAVLARLLDVSRSTAATWFTDGYFSRSGRPLSKSDRLAAGDEVTVDIPELRDPLEIVVEPVEGLKILVDDELQFTGSTVIESIAGASRPGDQLRGRLEVLRVLDDRPRELAL